MNNSLLSSRFLKQKKSIWLQFTKDKETLLSKCLSMGVKITEKVNRLKEYNHTIVQGIANILLCR